MSIGAIEEVHCGMGTEVSSIGMIMDNAPRQLAVLFADVSGSARLHEKLGDTEAARAVDRCMKRMERAIEGFGGRVIKLVGDEIMVSFDSVDEAFQAAVDMQQRVSDLPPVSGVKLAIRVGFSHGMVNEEGDKLSGETVDTAARLAGLALPGQILTSLQAQSELSPALKNGTRDISLALARSKPPGLAVVYEVLSAEPVTHVVKIAGSSELQLPSLSLRHSDKIITLDESKQVIRMGRGAESDVLIHDRRASRHHAQIERRGNRIFLIDKSTNGTFVTLGDKPELFLRRQECVLYGKGTICFAASASSPRADCAEFDQT